jgi:hypothetical protein
MRHPVRQGVGLARAGAGDDQEGSRLVQRVAAVLDRAPLFGVQLGKGAGARGERPGGGRGRAQTIRANVAFLQTISPSRCALLIRTKHEQSVLSINARGQGRNGGR